jgi:hypothetical protein
LVNSKTRAGSQVLGKWHPSIGSVSREDEPKQPCTLEQATAALLTKNPRQLKTAAGDLLVLLQEGNREFVAPFFIVADALPDVAARVEAYRDAVRYAARGSALEQQAVAGIVKHADALPDVAARVEAYRDAASYAVSGSALHKQAVSKLRELLQPQPKEMQPTRSQEIAAFVQRFGICAPK